MLVRHRMLMQAQLLKEVQTLIGFINLLCEFVDPTSAVLALRFCSQPSLEWSKFTSDFSSLSAASNPISGPSTSSDSISDCSCFSVRIISPSCCSTSAPRTERSLSSSAVEITLIEALTLRRTPTTLPGHAPSISNARL